MQTCICVLIRTASKCYLTHTKVQACSFTARGMFKSVITTSVIIHAMYMSVPTRIRIVFSGCQVEGQCRQLFSLTHDCT